MTSEAAGERERVRALVAECIERMEREGDAAVEAVCAAHPADAAAIRARLSVLVDIGLVDARGEIVAARPRPSTQPSPPA